MEQEVDIFLYAVLTGIFVFCGYQILLIRRLVKHHHGVEAVEDFLFWVATSLYLFLCIYNTSDGSMRWFFVVGDRIGSFFSVWNDFC